MNNHPSTGETLRSVLNGGILPQRGETAGIHFHVLKAILGNIHQIAGNDYAADCKCQSCKDRAAIMKLVTAAKALLNL